MAKRPSHDGPNDRPNDGQNDRPDDCPDDLDGLPESLRDLLDVPLASPALATRAMDGRLVPVVFANVVGPDGAPRAGVLVELLDGEGEVLDATRTSGGGLAVLRFPPRPPSGDQSGELTHAHGHGGHGGDGGELQTLSGTLRVDDGSREGLTETLAMDVHRSPVVKRLVTFAEPAAVVLAGDDQLARIPVDFSVETCAVLTGGRVGGLLPPTGLPMRDDPLLETPAAGRSLAGRRTPLVRRVDVVRWGPPSVRLHGGIFSRRYLVQLRQEWVLLGYTLGELSGVLPLDPGSVVQQADQLVQQASTAAREAVDTVQSTLTQTLKDVISELGTVDTVVSAAASASASVGGAGPFGIGLLLGGSIGATATGTATVSTSVDTSLLVNRSLQHVSTLVNQAVAQAQAVAEGAQRTAASVVNHLAPLVSRVTNALHWRVYENWAVCTHVDGVLAIEEYPIAPSDLFRFTERWARALRAYLEPALLDRTLVANFADLMRAAETPGVTTATYEITYRALALSAGTARVTLGGVSSVVALPPGRNTVRGTITFPTPVPPGTRLTGTAEFRAGEMLGSTTGTLDVDRFSIWVDNPLTGMPDDVVDGPGPSLRLDITTGGAGSALSGAVLVEHLNANRAYYLDVIAAAALRFPALRVDAGRDDGPLAGISPLVWRLPVVGFEGNKALVARPLAGTESVDVGRLLERDPGSGTLVQLLAPGSYGEVLQGLSALTDVATNLHPALKAIAPTQFVEFPTQPVLPATGPASSVTNVLDGVGG